MSRRRLAALAAVVILVAGSTLLWWQRAGRPASVPEATAGILLVTIDTLRADRVGAYGAVSAHTPTLDRLAREGVRFDRAFAVAPITLTSHASLLTGRYPPGHGSRHNGIRMTEGVPTLATVLRAAGFETAAFVSAFPLDRRFGLAAGFDVYDDRMPRAADGRISNERTARATVDQAVQWIDRRPRAEPFFLWVHLFEPHAPYVPEDSADAPTASVVDRYDGEVTVADRELGRLLDRLGSERPIVVVVAGDHGEAFGEHGEIGHSVFVYDTTLRVPLLIRAPGFGPFIVAAPVTLADVAPTLLKLAGLPGLDADGADLSGAMRGERLAGRELYAESFAPLVDFGWSPLRVLRTGPWKFIEAPRAELYQVTDDPGETRDLVQEQTVVAAGLHERLSRYGSPAWNPDSTSPAAGDPEAGARLRALGYASGSRAAASADRADPKDRRELAANIGRVASGELTGPTLEQALARILAEDPGNPQAHLRLGYVLAEQGRCDRARVHFEAAIKNAVSANPFLGLASCHVTEGRLDLAERTLEAAGQVERGNPVVTANLGVIALERGSLDVATARLREALGIDADLHQARFNLVRAYARAGRRAEALVEAEVLLNRLPAAAPQRPEVERLLKALKE